MSDALDVWEWFPATMPPARYEGAISCAASDGDLWVGFGYTSGIGGGAALALGSSAASAWTMTDFTLPRPGYIRQVIYADGRWVAVGGYTFPSTDHGLLIASTDDPEGTWDVQDNFTQSSLGWVDYGNGIAYGNGVWAATDRNGNIYTATDPAGTWTSWNQSSPASLLSDAKLSYANGIWLLTYFGLDPLGCQVWSTDDPSGTWTFRSVAPAGGAPVQYFADGWAIYSSAGVLCVASSLDGEWEQVTDLPQGGPDPGITRGQGYYVICGSGQYAGAATIVASQSLTGPYFPVATLDELVEISGGTSFLFSGGPYFNGKEWAMVGLIDDFPNPPPGVLSPGGGTESAGWGLTL